MVILERKLKASSLIEVVIAAVIILSSFTIAMSVLSRTASENDALHKVEFNALANQQFQERTVGEQDIRGMEMRSVINNNGDVVSEQIIMVRKRDDSKRKVITRRRLSEFAK